MLREISASPTPEAIHDSQGRQRKIEAALKDAARKAMTGESVAARSGHAYGAAKDRVVGVRPTKEAKPPRRP
ncbi:MAG: hypothetical protein ABUL73_04605 [Alphaproteobacteria bacterium]